MERQQGISGSRPAVQRPADAATAQAPQQQDAGGWCGTTPSAPDASGWSATAQGSSVAFMGRGEQTYMAGAAMTFSGAIRELTGGALALDLGTTIAVQGASGETVRADHLLLGSGFRAKIGDTEITGNLSIQAATTLQGNPLMAFLTPSSD